MASADFKKFARKYLKDFEKTAGTGKQSGRGKLQAQDFSIVVVDVKETRKAIQAAFAEDTFANTPIARQESILDTVMDKFVTAVKSMDMDKANKWPKGISEEFKKKIRKQRKTASAGADVAIIAGRFSGIQEWKKSRPKRTDGILIRAIKEAFKAEGEKTLVEADLKVLGGKGATGLQLEHGQYGGIASSTVRVIEAETKLENMSRAQKKKAFTSNRVDRQGLQKLEKAIEKYKVGMKLNIDRQQYMRASDMKLHAHLAPIVTITSAASNQEAANDEENAILKEFEKAITELISLPGSSTIDEMARDGILHNLNGNGKGRKTTGAGRPRKSQRTKTKGGTQGKFERKEKINIIRDLGHGLSVKQLLVAAKSGKNKGRAAPRAGEAPRKAGSSNMPLHLIGIINKELPQTVQANMGAPALTNRTGRFASSVRATDMIPTPQGFPSIGYTYQRDPYEVHEQDYHYDPRKLIDRSMREIAAQYAIGRFYTRRV